MSYHLINQILALQSPRILVLGDLILDRYLWGNAERVSQEAPVILLREEQQDLRLGGAANVANLLTGLGAEVTLAGVVGNDLDGHQMLHTLQNIGVDCSAILTDWTRPTTCKQRMIGHAQHRHPHQMLRVDRESREPLDGLYLTQIMDRVVSQIRHHDAILISDYVKGVCTPVLLKRIIHIARQQDLPVIVDPAPIADYSRYAGATAMTPNRSETGTVTQRTIRSYEDAYRAGQQLINDLCLERVFITLDKDGIAVTSAEGTCEAFPTRQRDMYDITGAGDMVLATIGLGAAAGWLPAEVAQLANITGGLEVEKVGVVRLDWDEVILDLLQERPSGEHKICKLEDVSRHLKVRKLNGQKTVFTNGCFDVFHIGHVKYLQQAAELGDCLVVAINSDRSVRMLGKGSDRPIFSEHERAHMLASLECVDYVVTFNEATPLETLQVLKPDLLVKGGTYRESEIIGRDLVLSYGGEVKALKVIPGVSSTQILARLRGEDPDPELRISA